MALMHGLARWASTGRRPPIHVATVDHGLRPEAAEEAAFVAWAGQKPETGIQEAAREARYRLLVEQARKAGASYLVTAHTLDDQAETVMMRLSRGSGLSGLAGMRRETDRQGIRHVRPLLGLPKSHLLDHCRRHGWRFVTDPSNADERYARVRWRRLMPLLAAEGLTAERLARLAERVARADEALDLKAREALDRSEPIFEAGTLSFQARALTDEPFDIALRVLELALTRAGLDLDNSRLHRLESCTERLRQAAGVGEALSLTIAGAHLRLTQDLAQAGRVSVGPEPPRHRGR
jgi:tRNA(Ile)-lysidine synthase